MFDRDIFKALMGELTDTREQEKLGCDECYEQIDRFVETELSGLNAAEAMPLVHEHLYLCGECRDEFEALLDALRALEDSSSPVLEVLERLRRKATPPYTQ